MRAVVGVDLMIAYARRVQVLVKCRTNDVSLPARAQVVIEFEVDFTQTVGEGSPVR